MPQKDDYTHEVGINPIYIKAVADALGMSKIQALQFNVKDSDSAIQVKRITEAYEDEKKESCIIMPVRLN